MYNYKRVKLCNYVHTGIEKVLLVILAVIGAYAKSLFQVQIKLKIMV